ncbi:phage virion morphogenesis protein, partial [Salmonella enterica subsp. enterica serovar Lansing]|nr:phage virion morphogenesis protein [Salmonella enterica subsp. enterica serovar Richmond]EDT3000920.1 phage virion morphogenesis protein [Salmonella enterica subsp. houtenae]EHS4736052.1 phage virion morphogenesis protein [Salmonella enterica]ECD7157503.1 phage virion morphogenesis protein [Salmonella enterica subsp. enterica serovar Richmond]ECG6521675.1 phage virion morphogenesis protein [Salmonella enterica subsp. enterica serovar Richmond]
RHSREVQYSARQLLGFSRDDEKIIESLIILAFGSG